MWFLLSSIIILSKSQYPVPDNYTLQSPIVIPDTDYPMRIVYAPDELSVAYLPVVNGHNIIFRSLLVDRMVEQSIEPTDSGIMNFAYSVNSDRLYILSQKSKSIYLYRMNIEAGILTNSNPI